MDLVKEDMRVVGVRGEDETKMWQTLEGKAEREEEELWWLDLKRAIQAENLNMAESEQPCKAKWPDIPLQRWTEMYDSCSVL